EPEPPDLVLIATGTEVHICARAADALEADGIATRLVSMPCMENFAAQDASYRDSVLPVTCRARVAVEAASPFGWREWVGGAGECVARSDPSLDGRGGRARPNGRRGVAARGYLEPGDLREGDPRLRRLRRGPADDGPGEPRLDRDLRAHRDPRRAARGRRAG